MNQEQSLLNYVFNIDKMKILLFVTRIWAISGIYLTKIIEYIFKIILGLPDCLLNVPANLCKNVKTTQNKKINIVNAYTENGNITNKMKLFLRYCWETGGNGSAFDNNGFSMEKASQLLNCSILYFSYILTQDNTQISPEKYINNITKKIIKFDRQTRATNIIEQNNKTNVYLGHISLDEPEPEPELDYDLDYEIN